MPHRNRRLDEEKNQDDPEPLVLLKLRQIGFADLLILNKTDLVSDQQIARVRAWVDSHLNRVRIIETAHCQVPLEILLGVGRFDPAQVEIETPAHAAHLAFGFRLSTLQ